MALHPKARSSARRRRAVTVVAVTLAGLAATPAATQALQAAPITWQTCHGAPYQCGSVRVPLDYDNPGGERISIALVRLPATNPAKRLGSLFLNPGGPGGSGADFVLGAGQFLYTEEVRARFDLVGFDPRGIGRSDGLRCFGTPAQWSVVLPPFAFPAAPQEEQLQAASDRTLAGACAKHATSIIDHMSTANVARDLDMLRSAVGDERLSYAGVSYGSYLGVTYANLFPDRVRALVVDGVLDPIAWATGRGNESALLPFSTRIRSDAGARATLGEFFRLCDEAGPDCALSGNAEARFATLAERARQRPLEIVFPDGFTIGLTYADLIATTLSAMYSSPSWAGFSHLLADLERGGPPAVLGARLQAYSAEHGWSLYPNAIEGLPGVSCSETDNPDSYDAWPPAAAQADQQFGYFGRPWTWTSSICAEWRGADADRYTGPFTARTANPVLVVGNRFDPATRYEGAALVHDLLPYSALLTVHGWGHTSLFLSSCADAAVTRYLVDGTTPAAEPCEQDVEPFATAPAARTAERRRQEALAPTRSTLAGRLRSPWHGGTWQADEPGSLQESVDPDVAVDAAGGAAFAWTTVDGATGRGQVQLRSRSARGRLGPAASLSDPDDDAYAPQVGTDAGGAAVVAWDTFDPESSGSGVQARRRLASGRLGRRLQISDPAVESFGVKTAVDGDGDAVFVWGAVDETTSTVGVRSRSLSGTGALGPIVAISGAEATAFGVDLAMNAAGAAVIAFPVYDPALGRPVVRARMRSAKDGLGPAFTVSDSPLDAPEATVAINDDGTAVFDWLVFDGPKALVQARTRSAAGVLGPVAALSPAGADAWDSKVALDGAGNAVVTWWLPTRDGARVQARARAADGSVGPLLDVSDPAQDGYDPQVAVDGAGNALLIWLAFDRAGVRVQGRTRYADGSLGSRTNVSYAADDAIGAGVAANQGGAAAFTWSAFGEEAYRVQGRVRSRQGAFAPPFDLATASRAAVEARAAATTRDAQASVRRRQAAVNGG